MHNRIEILRRAGVFPGMGETVWEGPVGPGEWTAAGVVGEVGCGSGPVPGVGLGQTSPQGQ